MSIRLMLSLVLTVIVVSAEAEGSQWLKKLIARQEQPPQYKKVKATSEQTTDFFSTHGLVFFYGSRCPHCQQFAPILKRWANYNKADVLPLSLDNQPLPEFPTFLPATTEWINAAFGGSAINYPATFIVSPKTHALYPVGFGSMTEIELNDRMNTLIPKIKAYETKRKML
ncbi:type-F conjugative transfer system pilin assembly thiol-disulfide isomerase TrbB [Legionella gresilensis]|uniref:type-F conjugative transfer system pilin assembly thiol-disulfide isomerase TrbB n=1 Tax=Legionella gresilensis TaxID=91823 RepID=UPI00104145C0|nr:type-F conjugative transfer system pilin assembly thiol-disulfide isomerase TrbB [Legionella gresilensis]